MIKKKKTVETDKIFLLSERGKNSQKHLRVTHGHSRGTTAIAGVLMWPFSCSRVAWNGWSVHGPQGMMGMGPSPLLQQYPSSARCLYHWLPQLQDQPVSLWLFVDLASCSTSLVLISNVTVVVTMSVATVARILLHHLSFVAIFVHILEKNLSNAHTVISGPHRKEILIAI